MSFASLGLADDIVRAVTEHGYTTPTPIQAQAIPAVLQGGDLLAGAQTGTGKTAGFTLPILQRLSQGGPADKTARRPIRALILTPTRELAAQVEESVKTYGKYLKLTSAVVFGGVGINPQIRQLHHGVDILVATPGRLLDHMQQGTVKLDKIEILVLDEADRMLDMGFIHDIKKVLAALPPKRQNLLFSATFSDDIKALADRLLNNPAMIEVARRNATSEIVAQKIHPVDRDRKHPLLSHLISTNNWTQVLVFTRTKHGANKLVEQLGRDGISGMAIHGNKSQTARTKALAEFKTGKLQVLVATDIAARGIDIDQLPHVVNYDLPHVAEDYVHRIGRTGRAGASGEAVSLVCVDERDMLHGIERLIKREIPVEVIAGFEPDPKAKPQPIQLRSQEHRQQRRPQGQGQGRGGKPAGAKPGAPGAAKPQGGKPAGPRPQGAKPQGGKPPVQQGQGQGQQQAKPAAPRPPQQQNQPPRQGNGGGAKLLGGAGSHKPAAPHRSGGRGR